MSPDSDMEIDERTKILAQFFHYRVNEFHSVHTTFLILKHSMKIFDPMSFFPSMRNQNIIRKLAGCFDELSTLNFFYFFAFFNYLIFTSKQEIVHIILSLYDPSSTKQFTYDQLEQFLDDIKDNSISSSQIESLEGYLLKNEVISITNLLGFITKSHPLLFCSIFKFIRSAGIHYLGRTQYEDIVYRNQNYKEINNYYLQYHKYPPLSFCDLLFRRIKGDNISPFQSEFTLSLEGYTIKSFLEFIKEIINHRSTFQTLLQGQIGYNNTKSHIRSSSRISVRRQPHRNMGSFVSFGYSNKNYITPNATKLKKSTYSDENKSVLNSCQNNPNTPSKNSFHNNFSNTPKILIQAPSIHNILINDDKVLLNPCNINNNISNSTEMTQKVVTIGNKIADHISTKSIPNEYNSNSRKSQNSKLSSDLLTGNESIEKSKATDDTNTIDNKETNHVGPQNIDINQNRSQNSNSNTNNTDNCNRSIDTNNIVSQIIITNTNARISSDNDGLNIQHHKEAQLIIRNSNISQDNANNIIDASLGNIDINNKNNNNQGSNRNDRNSTISQNLSSMNNDQTALLRFVKNSRNFIRNEAEDKSAQLMKSFYISSVCLVKNNNPGSFIGRRFTQNQVTLRGLSRT